MAFILKWHKGISINPCQMYISLGSKCYYFAYPDSKVHGANMGPTWVLSAPDGPHVGPMNVVIRGCFAEIICRYLRPPRAAVVVTMTAILTYIVTNKSCQWTTTVTTGNMSFTAYPDAESDMKKTSRGKHHAILAQPWISWIMPIA